MKHFEKNTTDSNTQSGFTLIEVLVAMAIMSIGLLALGMMQAHFAQGNAQSRDMIRATDIANNHIETLSNITNPGHADLTPGFHNVTVTDYPRDYNVAWQVVDNGNLTLTITVTVNWSVKGRNHSVTFPWIKDL